MDSEKNAAVWELARERPQKYFLGVEMNRNCFREHNRFRMYYDIYFMIKPDEIENFVNTPNYHEFLKMKKNAPLKAAR